MLGASCSWAVLPDRQRSPAHAAAANMPLVRPRKAHKLSAREERHEQARRNAAQRKPRLDRGARRRQRRRHDRGDGRGRRRLHLLHLGLGDRLLPGGRRQGACAGPQGAEADHGDARACVAQRRARLCRGERQARGDRGACRLRHAALRRRGAHRVPLRPAGRHHRRRLADELSRQHAAARATAAATSGCSRASTRTASCGSTPNGTTAWRCRTMPG